MKTGEIIRLLRKKNNMSQQELAIRSDYSDRSSIAKIEAGGVDLPESKILLFASIFDVTPAALMGLEDLSASLSPNLSQIPDYKAVPRIGRIACGSPILAEEHLDGYLFRILVEKRTNSEDDLGDQI